MQREISYTPPLSFSHQIQTYTQQLIGDTENMINEIGNCKDRHLKMERDRLVDEFTSALTAFQSVQRKMIEYERNALKQARMNANNSQPIARPPGSGANKNNNSSSYGSGGPFEDNFVGMAMSQQNQVQAQMQEDMDVQALEEQERSIRELEENIVGVNEIYKKLGSLVYEQGAMVDSIEANVEQTNVFVSEGTDQLKKAHHYKVGDSFGGGGGFCVTSDWIIYVLSHCRTK